MLEFKKLVDTQDEYIALLVKEINSMVSIAYTHGWRSDNHEAGALLREKIASLKQETAKADKTDNPLYKKSIEELSDRERQFYDVLVYILKDEELALGYCGNFESIAAHFMPSAGNAAPEGPWKYEVHHTSGLPETGCSGDEYATISDGKVTLFIDGGEEDGDEQRVCNLLNQLKIKLDYDHGAELWASQLEGLYKEACAEVDSLRKRLKDLPPDEQAVLNKTSARLFSKTPTSMKASQPSTSKEEDIIYRIVEQWGNAACSMHEKVQWLKDYAKECHQQRAGESAGGWVRITTEASLPPDDTGSPNPKKYAIRCQESDMNQENPYLRCDWMTCEQIKDDCQGTDWYEWLDESQASTTKEDMIAFGEFLLNYAPIEKQRRIMAWWDKVIGGKFYTTSELCDLYLQSLTNK